MTRTHTNQDETSAQAYIALGSNVPSERVSCEQIVRAAIATLDGHAKIDVHAQSRLYRTPAMTNPVRPSNSTGTGVLPVDDIVPYVNAVAMVQTTLPARALLEYLLSVERDFGRDRSQEQRWGSRSLDLDLLVYDDAGIDEPGLVVPHPGILKRTFVLEPLCEIAPELVVAGTDVHVKDGLARLVQVEPMGR